MLAHPDHDELRKVYGDALAELGDPHGELIALQFARLEGRATPETRERERVLLERHGAEILGPLVAPFGVQHRPRGRAVSASRPVRTVAIRYVHIGPWQVELELQRTGETYGRASGRCEYSRWISRPLDLTCLHGRVHEVALVVARPHGAMPPAALDELARAIAGFPVSRLEVAE